MKDDLKQRLTAHALDYEAVEGRKVIYFYCPILHVDEECEIQRGHVVNESFADSSRAWVVQRKDVDQFYGACFESDFEILQYAGKVTFIDLLKNKKLFSHFKPRLFHDEREISFYPFQGSIKPGYTAIRLEQDDKTFDICLGMTRSEIENAEPQRWSVEIQKDLRVPALPTLIKSAHLSMFSLLGYKYANSNAGVFIGHDILGNFYLNNKGCPRGKVIETALEFFDEFRNIACPLAGDMDSIAGTLTNGEILLCKGSSGQYWGMIVIVKTAHIRHAVLLPFPADSEIMVTYLDFLKNDNRKIHLLRGNYDKEKKSWMMDPTPIPLVWPKNDPGFLRIQPQIGRTLI